ncbi:MAG: methyltransferase domain-containing protein [bacterium]
MAGIAKQIKSAIPYRAKNLMRRIIYHGFLRKIFGSVVNDLYVYRESVASMYIKGFMRGIEIGALDRPMRLHKSAKTLYVDRMSAGDLVKEHPIKKIKGIVRVDIIDDGEKLDSVEDASLDYVIANHYIEHCRNPILAISNMTRVLKKAGILFLTAPDKRYIFDSGRRVTPFEHIVRDYEEGPECSDREHYEEWGRLVLKTAEGEVESKASDMIHARESIHFHVWTAKDYLEFILGAKALCGLSIELEHFSINGYEAVAVLRKV